KTQKLELWLLRPENSPRTSHDGTIGTYLELVGSQLMLTEVAKVLPEQPERQPGYLSITRRLPLGPLIEPLVTSGISGKLVISGVEAVIGRIPDGATTRDIPLASQPGAKIVVAELPHPVMPLPILIAGTGAALLGLILLLVSVLGRRGADASRIFIAPPVPPAAPPSTAIGSAQTQLSQHGMAAAAPT